MPVLAPSVAGLHKLYARSANPLSEYRPPNYVEPWKEPEPGPAPPPPPPPPQPLQPAQPQARAPQLSAPAPSPVQARSGGYGSEVERWRPLAEKYFRPEDVDKALYVINGESGGDPNVENYEGSGAEGLFQMLKSHGMNGKDPETAFRWAANQVYNVRGNWGDWGEGVLYQGKPFGVLGVHPYGGESSPVARSSASAYVGGDPLLPGRQQGVTSAVIARPDPVREPFVPESMYSREGIEPVGAASSQQDFGTPEPGLELEPSVSLARAGGRQPATVPVQGESDPYRLAVLTAFTQGLEPGEVDYALRSYEEAIAAGSSVQDAFAEFLDRRNALGENGRLGGLLGGATTNAELIKRFGADIAAGFLFGGPVGAWGAVAGDVSSELLGAALPETSDPYLGALRKGAVLAPNFLAPGGKQGVLGAAKGLPKLAEPGLWSRLAAAGGASALGQGFEAAGIPEVPGVGNVGELIGGGVAGGVVAARQAARSGGPALGVSSRKPAPLFTPKNLPAELRTGGRRVAGGSVSGLPPGVTTDEGIVNVLNKITSQAREAGGARTWYETSADAILNATQGDLGLAERLARITAITSTDTSVSGQGSFILKAWQQYMDGAPFTGMRYGSVGARLTRALSLDDDAWDKELVEWITGKNESAQKLGNFYLDLLDGVDPARALRLREASGATATIDRWMNRAFGYNSDTRTPGQYEFMGRSLEAIAKRMTARTGETWTPKQVQAAVWIQQKMGDEGLDLNDAGFDYGDSLRRHSAQMSWESAPGRSTQRGEALADYESWAPQEKAELHLAVARALQDDKGFDVLAREMGILTGGAWDGPGIYEGNLSPGTQRGLFAAQESAPPAAKGEKKSTVRRAEAIVDPAQRERISAYAAAMGKILQQDAVAWTRPFHDAPVWLRNGASINLGRMVTDEEAVTLSNLLGEMAGAAGPGFEDGIVILPTQTGAMVFRPPGDADFAARRGSASAEVKASVTALNKRTTQMLTDAIDQVWDNDMQVRGGTLATDGDYVSNDWSTSPHGEDYLGRIGTGRPGLQRLIAQLEARVSAADAVHAAKRQRGGTVQPNAGADLGSVAPNAEGPGPSPGRAPQVRPPPANPLELRQPGGP